MAFSLPQPLAGLFGGGRAATPQAPAQPVEALQQQQDEAALADLVQKRYAYARDSKQVMLETWATCLAFFVGEQWRQWEDKQKRLVQPTRIPSWRVLPVFNQLPGIVDTTAAKLSRARQLPRARPDDSEDPQDQARAEKGTAALRGWWHHTDMDAHEHEANINRILFGGSFYHLYWDPEALAKVPVPEVDPLTGMTRMRAEYAPVGELCTEVLTVFDVFPEPRERFSDSTWCIIARRHPLYWFEQRFGEKGKQVTADKGDIYDVFSSLIPGGSGDTVSGSKGDDRDGMATLFIYYERPCPQYPEGRTVYCTQKTVLFSIDKLPLPYKGLKQPLPVKSFWFRHVPKRLWGKGLIEECLSPQREMNRGLGNLAEIFRAYRSPKWFVEEGSVEKNAITSCHDEVVNVRRSPSFMPVAVSPPNLPAWVQDYAGIQREELRQVSGLHEVSEGQVPGGVTAASAIQMLQQAENVRMSSPALLGKVGLEEFAKHVLTVLAERYREPRLLTVPQRAGMQQSVTVTGEEIGPLEVVVEMAEGVEDNDAVRGEVVVMWNTLGLFNGQMPPEYALPILRDIGQGWLADIVEQGVQQVQMRQMQEQMMLQQQALDAQAQQGDREDQRAAEERDAQAQEAEAGRQHQAQMAGMNNAARLAQTVVQGAMRPQPTGGKR